MRSSEREIGSNCENRAAQPCGLGLPVSNCYPRHLRTTRLPCSSLRKSPRSRCLSARKCGRYSSACSWKSRNMDVGSLIEKALRDVDPIKALRSLAVELSNEG